MYTSRFCVASGLAFSLLLAGCVSNANLYDPVTGPLPSYSKTPTQKRWGFYKKDDFFPAKTSLELRSMQTRKFAVSYLPKFYNAFKTDCVDSDGRFSQTIDGIECVYKTNMVFSFSGDGGKDYNWLVVRYSPELDSTRNFPKNHVIVRLRIYASTTNYGSPESPQFTLPVYYQTQFSRMADALFVNAIELTPQEMK